MNSRKKRPEGGLLQSKEWAQLLSAEGKKVVNIFDRKTVKYGVLHKLPIVGRYMYVPRTCNFNKLLIDDLFDKIHNNYCGWVRVDICDEKLLDIFCAKGVKCVKAPHNMQPKCNLIIDITKDEEELLKQMKSKTRYNIRLAQKKGVTVFCTSDKKYIDIFCDLVEETAHRKDLVFHSRKHYHEIFNNIPDDIIQLYIAQYNNKIIATNIISFYGGVATYLHGATSDKYRNVMAPFLLQWQAIKDAKKRGCQWYDFGGVFPDSNNMGKKGITRFKIGFSPKTEYFITEGSYDIIISNIKYKLYTFLQKIKRL